MKKLFGISLVVLTLSLIACGGGGASDTSYDTKTNVENTVITANCSISTVSGVNTHSVIDSGCILKLKAGTQTGYCSGTTLKMLSGTDWTQTDIKNKGSTFSATNLTLNGEVIKCI